ncbi:hypothetical protein FRC01_013681 [Tulasnella sp. 417]|nr:hypothetical protein FRC01_013681 [Tulasnella sp. 417]
MGSSLTLTSNTTSSSASNPYSPVDSRDLGGNRLWYEQMKRMYRDITDLEGALLKENDVVEEDVDSRHSVRVQPSRATEEKWPRDLPRYQVVVIAHVQEGTGDASSSKAAAAAMASWSSSPPSTSMMALIRLCRLRPRVSRVDDSPLPSIGAQAAAELELRDDAELWGQNAREWDTKASRIRLVKGGCSIIWVWSAPMQGSCLPLPMRRRPRVHPSPLLRRQAERLAFTIITRPIHLPPPRHALHPNPVGQLPPSRRALKERIQLNPEEITEAEWTMMAVLNISAVLDYEQGEGMLRKVCGWMSPSAGGPCAANGQEQDGSPGIWKERRFRGRNAGGFDSGCSTSPQSCLTSPKCRWLAPMLQGPMEALSTNRPPVEELPYTAQLARHLTFELLLHTM